MFSSPSRSEIRGTDVLNVPIIFPHQLRSRWPGELEPATPCVSTGASTFGTAQPRVFPRYLSRVDSGSSTSIEINYVDLY